MGDQIRVVIADDHMLLREMLSQTLRQEKSIEVVGEVGNGLQTIDVISEKTVNSHLNSIFKKLNVNRRVQAILYAIKRGLS